MAAASRSSSSGQTSLALAGPLVRIRPAHESNALYVPPRTDGHFLPLWDRRELMALLLTLDACAERAEKVQGAGFTKHAMLRELEAMCRLRHPRAATLDVLGGAGVLQFAPYLERLLRRRQRLSSGDGSGAARGGGGCKAAGGGVGGSAAAAAAASWGCDDSSRAAGHGWASDQHGGGGGWCGGHQQQQHWQQPQQFGRGTSSGGGVGGISSGGGVCGGDDDDPLMPPAPAPQQHPGVAHLAHVAAVNQVVMLATQLYGDATRPPRHKYAAHQLALLYQALNLLHRDTKPVRRLIEARFDEVKAASEGGGGGGGSGTPVLTPELASWLQQVTWLCREEVAQRPEYIARRLQPMKDALLGDG